MADLAAKIFNEKIKGLSTTGRTGAVVVAGAGIAKWYNEGISFVMASWLATAAIMTYMATELLNLMQMED